MISEKYIVVSTRDGFLIALKSDPASKVRPFFSDSQAYANGVCEGMNLEHNLEIERVKARLASKSDSL